MYAAVLAKTCMLVGKQMKANPGKADARENKAKHDVAVMANENVCAGSNNQVPEFMQEWSRHAGPKAVCVRAGLGSFNRMQCGTGHMCLTIVALADSWTWLLEPESIEPEHMICSTS